MLLTRRHGNRCRSGFRFLFVLLFLLGMGGASLAQIKPHSQITPTVTLTLSADTVASGSPVTLMATATSGNSPVSPGLVTFCNALAQHCEGSAVLGTAQLTPNGTATIKLMLSIGTHSIKATLPGGVSSTVQPLTVTGLNPTTTSIAATGNPGNYTLTATVVGHGLTELSGSVSFVDTSDGNFVLGTATLGASKVAQIFTPNGAYAAGDNSIAVAVGDFNGDGRPDLAVVNAGDNNVTVLLGQSGGTFNILKSYPTGLDPISVAVGDFDSDGNLDLAVVNQGDNTVSVLLGDGKGGFTTKGTPAATGKNPDSVAVGDFNGDGVADLAVTNNQDSTVSVLLGNGDGTFKTHATPKTGLNPEAVAVGDFNGDGEPDLAVVNGGDDSITILLNDGNGSFTPKGPYPDGGSSVAIAIGDFDGDGVQDLAVANQLGNAVSVLLGNGDGTFRYYGVFQVGETPVSVAIGDFNGDGIPDLVTANSNGKSGSSVTELLGNGNGTFGPQQMSYSGGIVPNAVVVGDFNGDGLPDLAVASLGEEASVRANDADPVNTLSVLLDQVTQTATATLSKVAVPGTGPQQVDANYPGDSSYSSSTSDPVTLMGTGQTQTIAFAPATPVTYGVTPVTLTATASSSLPVTFKYISGPATLNGSTLTITGAGNVVVQANQAGNADYSAAPPVQATIVVNKATLTVKAADVSRAYGAADPPLTDTITGFVNKDTQATAVTGTPVLTTTDTSTSPVGPYTITVAAGTLAAANYVFTFVNGTLTVGQATQTITFAPATPVTYGVTPITLTATASSSLPVTYKVISGPATLSGSTLTITGAGSVAVQASQAGNADYSAAIPVSATIVVNKATLTVTATNLNRAYGATNPPLTDTITGFVNKDTQATAVTGTPVLATAAINTSPIGPYPITVAAGTLAAANYTFTLVNGTLTVGQAAQTINFALASPVTYGVAPIPLTATASSGLPVSYTVTGPATLSGSTLTITGAGNVGVTASQAGDADYSAATPVSHTLVVNKAALVITPANASSSVGAPLPALTGTITGLVNGDNITATYSTTATATSSAGTYPITATPNDPNNRLPNYDVTLHQGALTITQNALTVKANNATRVYGTANPVFTGTLTGVTNGDTFTESFVTTATLTSPVASYAIVPSAIGVHLANYTVTTVNGILTVTQAASTTALTTSNTNPNLNAPVTFTATVASATTGTPTGNVQFLDGTTVLGTSPLNAGVASYTTSSLSAGTHTISATYSGDQNFIVSSAILSQQVATPTFFITANVSTLTLQQGQTGLPTITLTPTGGYTGTVAFTCGGLPDWAACSFAPGTLKADGSNTASNTQMTIITLGPNKGTASLSQTQTRPGSTLPAEFYFLPATLLGGLLFWQRRRLSAATQRSLVAVMLLAGAIGVIGCGFSRPDVPLGSSTVTVTGTGPNNVVKSTTFTLTVTQ